MASPTSKKAAPTAAPTHPAPRVDPLANLTQHLDANTLKTKASHLDTYRRAVKAIASGCSVAPEEEQPLADALAFFDLDTDSLKRDVSTVQAIESQKKILGATVEERVARSDATWAKAKASAAGLDKFRDALKKAEEEHIAVVRESNAFGESCGQLNRLISTNPRLFAVEWPLPPQVVTLPLTNPVPPPSPPPPPPPPVSEIYHPWFNRMVPITPEQFTALSIPTPATNVTPQEQAAFDKQMAEKRAALANKTPTSSTATAE